MRRVRVAAKNAKKNDQLELTDHQCLVPVSDLNPVYSDGLAGIRADEERRLNPSRC